MVRTLNKDQRQWVSDIGFESLLALSVDRIDQHLCYWIMQRFDPYTKTLTLREDHAVRIDVSDIGWVLGIPMGPYTVQVDKVRKGKLERLKEVYNNSKGIDEDFLRKKVQEGRSREQFNADFLLYVLGVLLCPTQSNRISPHHLRALCLKDKIEKYNWCKYVLDWLVKYGIKFKQSIEKSGHGGGLGGCSLFLMVIFSDYLIVLTI